MESPTITAVKVTDHTTCRRDRRNDKDLLAPKTPLDGTEVIRQVGRPLQRHDAPDAANRGIPWKIASHD